MSERGCSNSVTAPIANANRVLATSSNAAMTVRDREQDIASSRGSLHWTEVSLRTLLASRFGCHPGVGR